MKKKDQRFWYGCLETPNYIDYILFDRERQRCDLSKIVSLFCLKRKSTVDFSTAIVKTKLRPLREDEYHLRKTLLNESKKERIPYHSTESYHSHNRDIDDFEKLEIDYADRFADWARDNPGAAKELININDYVCSYDPDHDL